MSLLEILGIITSILLVIIMIVFIIIEIKGVFFLRDVNKSLDEMMDYLKSINWIFDIIDYITEKVYNFKDKFSFFFSEILGILFKR